MDKDITITRMKLINTKTNETLINMEIPDSLLDQNLERLDRIAELEFNWNGYGADKLHPKLIEQMKNILLKISFQPDICPVAGGAIQFQYEKENGDYLEFELYEDGRLEKFILRNDNSMDFGDDGELMDAGIDSINKVINDFFGKQLKNN